MKVPVATWDFLRGETWMDQAACAGKAPNVRSDPEALDLWFPEKGESHNPAKVICFSQCPVRTECEAYRQLTDSDHGIWAGMLREKDE